MKCCDPESLNDLAAKAAALSHPSRLLILQTLAGAGACCCKEVVGRLDLAQSTVSQHLKVLVDAGLVRYVPERQRSRYSVDTEALDATCSGLAAWLGQCAKRAAGTPDQSCQTKAAQ